VQALAADGRAVEFVKDQYRHCKPMLISADSAPLLGKAGIPAKLPSGAADPGLVTSVDAFLTALAKHRHFERETDPPIV
jgi:catalase